MQTHAKIDPAHDRWQEDGIAALDVTARKSGNLARIML